MSLLAYLVDRAHHALVCRRRGRALARRLSALSTTIERPARDARVMIRGRFEPRELLVAPLSASRVVGYRVLVEIPAASWINRRLIVDYSRMASGVLHVEGLSEPLAVSGGAVDLLVETPCLEGRRRAGSAEDPQAFAEPIATVLADRAQIRAEATDPHRYRWAEYHFHGDEVVQLAGRLIQRREAELSDEVGDEVGDQERARGGETSSWGIQGLAEQVGERLLVTTVARGRLLKALDDPDQAWLRALPGRAQSDRSD